MAAELVSGSLFAGYRVDGVVARGGMGVVYRAYDPGLERPVALKLIAPEVAGDPRFRERFLRETRLAAALEHPHVLPVYAVGEEEGVLFVATRFVDGESLESRLRREGNLSPAEAARLVSELAGALDAAHARGLVHGTVTAESVLLDGSGATYLADLGLPAASPAGDTPDVQADRRALAVLLRECLASAGRDVPEEPAGGWESCAAFAEAVRRSLGVAIELRRAPLLPPALRRRGKLLLVAGVALAAGAAAAAVLLATGDSDPPIGAVAGNTVVVIDPKTNEILAQIPVGSSPASIAVGEGAVWVLNADDQTISRIEPETKAVDTFAIGETIVQLVAGAGSLWVATGGEGFFDSVRQLDPLTRASQRSIALPAPRGLVLGNAFAGSPPNEMTIGAGALWVVNVDHTIARVDVVTGRARTVAPALRASAVAADGDQVWAIADDGDVVRIGPESNRVAARVELPAADLSSIAVGGGAVWAGDAVAGIVWRVDPGPRPTVHTIQVPGLWAIAFGEGALWATSIARGNVSRIDPSTNRVSQIVRIGNGTAGIVAGEHAVWAAVVGAGAPEAAPSTNVGALTNRSCAEAIGADRPTDFLVVASLNLRAEAAGFGAPPGQLVEAIERVLGERDFRAGSYTVALQVCDDSTSQSGGSTPEKCIANAQSYAANPSVIGVIGPSTSGCAADQIPILNAVPGGPLALVSPTNSYPGLTRRSPVAEPGEPESLYPTGRRSYVRLYTSDDFEWAAGALLARDLGAESVFVVEERGEGFTDFPSIVFRRVAKRLGLSIAGRAGRNPESSAGYRALARKAARSGADAVYLSVGLARMGPLLASLRGELGPGVPIIAAGFPGVVPIPELVAQAGSFASGLYVGFAGIPNEELPPAGQTFLEEFAAVQPEGEVASYGAAYVAQAAELLLDAIGRSDGTRSSVVDELFKTEIEDGILGSFRIDANGDSTSNPVTIFRVDPGAETMTGLPELFDDATVERMITVPPELLVESP